MSNNQQNLNDWLTKQQAATALGVSEKTIDRMADRGEIQRTRRKRPGLAPVAVFHPEELRALQALQGAPVESFVVPAGQEMPAAVAKPEAVTLVAALMAIAERVAAPEVKEPHWLTLKQAREVSGLPLVFLRQQFIATGRAIRTGGGWRISRVELERFARESRAVGQVSDLSRKG